LGEIILLYFTVKNLKTLNYIPLFYCRSANRVQTKRFASVSPTDTLRVQGLTSWTFVCRF